MPARCCRAFSRTARHGDAARAGRCPVADTIDVLPTDERVVWCSRIWNATTEVFPSTAGGAGCGTATRTPDAVAVVGEDGDADSRRTDGAMRIASHADSSRVASDQVMWVVGVEWSRSSTPSSPRWAFCAQAQVLRSTRRIQRSVAPSWWRTPVRPPS